MRELKFRAWDTFNNRFVKPEHLEKPNLMSVILTDTGFRFPTENESTFIFMQYTGLKDKNGKEIYEGDIVKINSLSIPDCEYLIIKFLNGCFVESYYHYSLREYAQYMIEIIGNIYENQELLK